MCSSDLEGEGWGTPVNLGSTINTPMNEMFPYMMNDTMLYFASNGLYGLGGLDIYSSKKGGNSWSRPTNLGYPINTSHDDFGYLPEKNGETGYFTSNRESNDRSTDKIYHYIKPELKFTLAGSVVNKSDQSPVQGAIVTLLNKKTGVKENTTTDADGNFKFLLSQNTDYSVTANKDGYFSKTEDITTIGKKVSEIGRAHV